MEKLKINDLVVLSEEMIKKYKGNRSLKNMLYQVINVNEDETVNVKIVEGIELNKTFIDTSFRLATNAEIIKYKLRKAFKNQ